MSRNLKTVGMQKNLDDFSQKQDDLKLGTA